MNEQQRAMLLDLISEWAGIVHDSAAAARMAEIKAGIDEPGSRGAARRPRRRDATAPPTTGSRGRISSSSTRLSRWAAIPRCTSIRSIAIRPTITAGRPRPNENEAGRRKSICCRSACRASAHRLDEYLQATTISLEKNPRSGADPSDPRSCRVSIRDGDHRHQWRRSHLGTEQRAYAERVLGDLSLAVMAIV